MIKGLQTFEVVNKHTIFAGTSGGSIAAVVACLDIPPEEAMDVLMQMAQKTDILLGVDDALKTTLSAILSQVKTVFIYLI